MTTNLGLNNYEFYFGPAGGSGLTFGVDHTIDVLTIEGLTDLEVLYSDQQHLLEHGDVPGVHLAVGNIVRLELEVRLAGRTNSAWRTELAELEAAFSVLRTSEEEFHWKLPGEEERFIRARPVRRRRIIDPDSELGIATVEVELRQADPRNYRATKQTDNLNATGTFTVVNNGEKDAYPLITFATGVGNSRGRIEHNDLGITLDVISGYSENQQGFADMDKRIRGDQGAIIYDHNGDSVYGAWQAPRVPFRLRPGNNSIDLLFADTVSFEWWETRL